MKAYVITTGVVFGLITVLHIWRVIAEQANLARDWGFIVLTAIAAGLCLWAASLIWRWPRS